MGTLRHNSVEINASRASTSYSVQSVPPIPLNIPPYGQYDSTPSPKQPPILLVFNKKVIFQIHAIKLPNKFKNLKKYLPLCILLSS